MLTGGQPGTARVLLRLASAPLAGRSWVLAWAEEWGELRLARLGSSAESRVVQEDEKPPPCFYFRLCLGVSLWERLL